MAPLRSFLLSFYYICLFAVRASGRESAWNGHTTPESVTKSKFTPFYAAPGTKSYDSASPFIKYEGKWFPRHSRNYISGSVRTTNEAGAAFRFAFTGTGIEWFGNCDRFHGCAKIFIDDKEVQIVDLYCETHLRQQRLFWAFDLPDRQHIFKVVHLGASSCHPQRGKKNVMDVDALVVTRGRALDTSYSKLGIGRYPGARSLSHRDIGNTERPRWKLTDHGTTGVAAMQLAIISPTHALIVDKVEHNPLTISGHPAWAALYNLDTHAVKPLRMQSNSFCAGGTFLSNGTLINAGGNPVVEDYTSAADFGDLDGLQAIRLFHPCDSDTAEGCEIYENHERIRMATPRWYATTIRIQDGSAIIVGGSKKGGWINNATVNNPTIEYYPPKAIHGSKGMPIHMQFLKDTLSSNLFPIMFLLPDGRIFIAANQDATIYDWEKNTEQRLPAIPNGVRVTYPMSGTGLMLPLSYKDNYTPEILLCGGSTISDQKPVYEISSQEVASAQCSRIILTEEGISQGWQVEEMPEPRTMLNAVLLPTGQIVIVNGAGSGISGYGNVLDRVGQSNADNPVLTPVTYDPQASLGGRFHKEGMPTSSIPRMYHSVATLTPRGNVMITGSNPNLDRSNEKYGTEYRVEWLDPPYMQSNRPTIKRSPGAVKFGEPFRIRLSEALGAERDAKVALMDLGFVTHGVHSNSRLVYLEVKAQGGGDTLHVIAPPNGKVYPPGPGWLYVVLDGVPSEGMKIMIGGGKDPVVDRSALENVLTNTHTNMYRRTK